MPEIELKFLISKDDARRLKARVKSSGLARGRSTTRTIRSTYFDTPEQQLQEAGLSLRVRREGRRWLQAVKSGRSNGAGLTTVDEIEVPVPGDRPHVDAIPEPKIRSIVEQQVNGSPLEPYCESLIRRTTTDVELADGTRAEIAIDAGDIRVGDQSAEIGEAEIELKAGSTKGLFDIAHILFPEGGIRFSGMSKLARAQLLAEQGRVTPPLVPRLAKPVPIDATMTVERAARDIFRECFDQIATNMNVIAASDDPEGPHQLRIGLRRLRSAFNMFGQVMQSPEMERLGREARWIGGEVGFLRDLDVLVHDIVLREADAHPEEPSLPLLKTALARHSEETRSGLRACLVGRPAQTFVIDLAAFVETRGWLVPEDFGQSERLAAPITSVAADILSHRWAKLKRHARGIDGLDLARRHEFRKEVKKLRYAVEFLAPLFDARRIDPFRKRSRKLQNALGSLNDVAMTREILGGGGLLGGHEAALARAIGWVMGANQARADLGWGQAKTDWRRFRRAGPFWTRAAR